MKYQGHTLDRFQVEAIDALNAGESVLVCAPTGTGKRSSRIGSSNKHYRMDARWFPLPIKPSPTKSSEITALFGEEKVGLVTGDLVIRRDAPCRVMTTEILRNILLLGERLPNLAAVIIDEIHFLDDKERGTTWEELLIYLDPNVQIVGLSATLANQEDFAAWLETVRGRRVRVVEEHQRAVPLTFRVATRESDCVSRTCVVFSRWKRKHAHAGSKMRHSRGGDVENKDGGNHAVRGDEVDEIESGHSHATATFECYGRTMLHICTLSSPAAMPNRWPELGQSSEQTGQDDEQSGLLTAKEKNKFGSASENSIERRQRTGPRPSRHVPTGHRISSCRIACRLKALVEELYESRLIKVLYCTGTFALGINMPARTAVFDGLMRFDGQGMIQLPTRELKWPDALGGGMHREGML